MSKSRFIEAERLKPFIVYCALAVVVMLAVGTVVPVGRLRTILVFVWVVLFPFGGWAVLRRK